MKKTNGLKPSNIERLRCLMREHDLTAKQVGAMTMRQHQTVRSWMCGAGRIPDHAIELLSLKLSDRK